MRKIIWGLGWIGVAVWTAVSLGAYAFLRVFGDVARGAAGYVPGFPVDPLSPAWLVDVGANASLFAVTSGWLIGCAVILVPTALVAMFFRRKRRGDDDDDRRRDWRRRGDDDDRRRDDTPRFDPRSMRVPGLGRSSGPHGRDMGLSDIAEKLLTKARKRF
jgi:hypothetical protein